MIRSIIVFLFIALVAFSCSIERKAIKKLNWIEYKAPEVIAKKCSDKYPVKTNTIIEKEFIKGDVITVHDSIELDCDTVTEVKYKDRKIRVPFPVTKVRVDTYKVNRTDTIENTAKVDFLQLKSDRLFEQSVEDSLTIKNKNRKIKWLIGSLVAIVLMIGLRIYLNIKRG